MTADSTCSRSNPHPENRNAVPETLYPERRNPRPEARNPKSKAETRGPKTRGPKTRSPKTRDPRPEAQHPKSETRYPKNMRIRFQNQDIGPRGTEAELTGPHPCMTAGDLSREAQDYESSLTTYLLRQPPGCIGLEHLDRRSNPACNLPGNRTGVPRS